MSKISLSRGNFGRVFRNVLTPCETGKKSNLRAKSDRKSKNSDVIAKEYKSVFATTLDSLRNPSGAMKIAVPPDLFVSPKSPMKPRSSPSLEETNMLPGLTSPWIRPFSAMKLRASEGF